MWKIIYIGGDILGMLIAVTQAVSTSILNNVIGALIPRQIMTRIAVKMAAATLSGASGVSNLQNTFFMPSIRL